MKIVLTVTVLLVALFGIILLKPKRIPQAPGPSIVQVELAKMDLEIKEAQLETAQAKARLDRELAKPIAVQQSLSPDGITEQIELLQDATADYARKSRHLKLLIEARAKIDKK